MSSPIQLPFRGVENNTSLYLPLDSTLQQTRCLDIHPGLTTDPLVCSLRQITLDQASTYEALSYCWGDVRDTVGMRVHFQHHNQNAQMEEKTRNNLPGGSRRTATKLYRSFISPLDFHSQTRLPALTQDKFRITKNLGEALRALRFQDKSRTLCVDAVCINQNDDWEKTHQVGFMGKTFSPAKHVLVWLGPGDISSQILHQVSCKHVQPSAHEFAIGGTLGMADWLASRLTKAMLKDDELLQLIATFVKQDGTYDISTAPLEEQLWYTVLSSFNQVLGRPWWYRIWVVQEVMLAENLQVTLKTGEQEMSWLNMVNVMHCIDNTQIISKYGNSFKPFRNFRWYRMTWVGLCMGILYGLRLARAHEARSGKGRS